MSSDYECILLVKNEVFVYQIPPRQSNRGYRAADWQLDKPNWTGRLRVTGKGKILHLKLEDGTSGQLFAKCPVESYPSPAVEAVTDSSRYFVLKLQDDNGRAAFVGMGFADRGDSFDLNVAMQDFFKQLKQEEAAANQSENPVPQLDLGFKEGQTIKLQLKTKRSGDETEKAKPRVATGASSGGLLPPPPAGSIVNRNPGLVKFPPNSNTTSSRVPTSTSYTDDLLGLNAPSTNIQQQHSNSNQFGNQTDLFGDFRSCNANSNQTSNISRQNNWAQFDS